jgi:hypothetical protein
LSSYAKREEIKKKRRRKYKIEMKILYIVIYLERKKDGNAFTRKSIGQVRSAD